MGKEELMSLKDDIMELFHGLQCGEIEYQFDNLHSAMKTNICEVFSDIAEGLVWRVIKDEEVSKEMLLTFHNDLLSFGEEFGVEEVKPLAEKAKKLADAE